GALAGRFAPGLFTTAPHNAQQAVEYGPALIGDDSPAPRHARLSWHRFAGVLGVGVALWGGGMVLLVAGFGWHGALTQMA
ncbi:chromate transporter, partial [Acinetobacter baumannii]